MGETIRIDPNRFSGPGQRKGDLEDSSKEASIQSSRQSTASSAATSQRERAEFILKYGIPPEDVKEAKTIPGDPTKTGEEYLATIKDKGLVSRIRALSEGRMSWPKGAALRNPAMAELIAAAMVYDPSLDEANSATRVATRKDFTSGVSARNLTAINTAIGHLADLRKLALALNNSGFPDVNAFINNIQSERLGDPRVNNYRTAADAFASELAKTFKGGTPALAEIEDWKKRTNANMSPEQFQGFVDTAAKLLNSRIEAVGDQYNRGMGRSSDPITLLSPHAQELYKIVQRPLDESKTVDALAGPDEGQQVTGEYMKGYRFSPEAEATIVAYAKQADATPEGYAKLYADLALKENIIKPEDRADFERGVMATNEKFFKQSPELRAQSGGLDYTNVDKSATENAGLLEGVAQRVRNAPESAYNLATGLMAPATDLAKSVLRGERTGLYQFVPDLAADVTGFGSGETLAGLKEAMADRYGSAGATNRTSITDPFGFLADLSIPITAGGTLLERGPGLVSKFGNLTSEVTGRMVNPLSATIDVMSYLKDKYKGSRFGRKGYPSRFMDTAGDIVTEGVALPSGVGGRTLSEGFEAGRGKGLAGAETPQSTAFTQNLRDPYNYRGDVINQATNAIKSLREQGTNAYLAKMKEFGQNPTPLSPDALLQTMDDLKPKHYDVMLDAPNRPHADIAWQQMNETVQHYLAKAAQDPSLLTPMALDEFKQNLYSIGSKIAGTTDADAARIAGQAYRSVKDILQRHDPVYADAMKAYSTAAEEAAGLESGFSLTSPKGKPINQERALRNLMRVFKENPTSQGFRIGELNPTDTLNASLAGQIGSPYFPSGVRRVLEGSAAGAHAVHSGLPATFSALLDPSVLAGLSVMSPRAMSELSYFAGRGVGAAERVGGRYGRSLLDLADKYPTTLMGVERFGDYGDLTDIQRLREKFGMPDPLAVTNEPAEISEQAEQGPKLVPSGDGVFYLMENGQIDLTRRDANGNPIEQKARGGLMSLARKYG